MYYIQTEEKTKYLLEKQKNKIFNSGVLTNFFFDVSSGSGFWRQTKRVHNSSAIGHVNMCENRDVSWARINFHDEMKN